MNNEITNQVKRIFVGFSFSPVLQKEILAWQSLWRERLPVEARWLAGANLHLTLVPPWPAREDQIAKVIGLVKKAAAGAGPLRVEFSKITYGPEARRPRLIWATGQANAAIIDLKNKLAAAFKQNSGQESFLLHATLARFRPEDFSRFKAKILMEKISWTDETKSVVVFESKLSSQGAEYLKLAEIELAP